MRAPKQKDQVARGSALITYALDSACSEVEHRGVDSKGQLHAAVAVAASSLPRPLLTDGAITAC